MANNDNIRFHLQQLLNDCLRGIVEGRNSDFLCYKLDHFNAHVTLTTIIVYKIHVNSCVQFVLASFLIFRLLIEARFPDKPAN